MNLDKHQAERAFDGVNYKLVKLPPVDGGRVATNVAKLLAPVLDNKDAIGQLLGYAKEFLGKKPEGATPEEVEAAKAAGNEKLLAGLLNDGELLLSALVGGVARVDVDALYDVAMRCVKHGAWANNARLNDDNAVNKHFSDYPEQLLPVLVWALQVNSKGFFAKGGPA